MVETSVSGLDIVLDSFDESLEAFTKDRKVEPVIVGYTQNYALVVHERLGVNHPVGQAKYLESAVSLVRPISNEMIKEAVGNGVDLAGALLLVGYRIEREAKLKTPVDTGALKASAFTSYERDADKEAKKALDRSNEIKNRKKKSRKK